MAYKCGSDSHKRNAWMFFEYSELTYEVKLILCSILAACFILPCYDITASFFLLQNLPVITSSYGWSQELQPKYRSSLVEGQGHFHYWRLVSTGKKSPAG